MMITFDEFLKMDPEQARADAEKSMWRTVELSVIDIARARRCAELSYDISNEEFDRRLNEICEKAHEKYSNMSKREMSIDMLGELIRRIN